MRRRRVRIRFSKLNRLKFIGHNDLLRTLASLFRRARIPAAMSAGFRPKVRMSFPSALPLGFESTDEVLELELQASDEPDNVEKILADLNRESLEGLTFLSGRMLQEDEKKASLISATYRMNVPTELREKIAESLASFLTETSHIVGKANGKRVDVREAVLSMTLESSGELTMELQSASGPSAGVKEVLSALGLGNELFVTLFPCRSRCRLFGE